MYVIKRTLVLLSLFGSLLVLNTSAFAACGKVHLGDFDWDSANAVSYTHLTLPTILLV